MYKDEIILDKPIYVGTTILDLSKLFKMRFHYDVVQKHFNGKSELLYSDTDSLVYHIFVDDLYEWMKENKNLFDLSDFIRDDIRDGTNKKKLGVMKDELNGLPINEFISLGPKCYSFTYKENVDKNIKKAKGVSKTVVKNEITHNDYKDVVSKCINLDRNIMSIRSFKHQLYTIQQKKTCLSCFYDKAELIGNIHTLPYGYKNLNNNI